MSIKFRIYKCNICGNIVQVLIDGEGELVCCGEEMALLELQNEENEMGEKHIPEITTAHEGCESGVCTEVKYVSVNKHPMTNEHHVQFIEVYNKEQKEMRIKFFSPEEFPSYKITGFEGNLNALELCNIHGLWGNKTSDRSSNND